MVLALNMEIHYEKWLLGFLMLVCPHLLAQEVRAVRFDTIGWAFAPAVVGDSQVLGFLSWAKTDTVGQNISLLWHEYDQFQDTFTTYAWKHDDVGAAAHWLRGEFQDEHFFALDDELPEFMATADPALIVSPQTFSAGLFEDDPLVQLIQGIDDPSLIIEALTGMGYQTAPLLSEMQTITGSGAASNGFVDIGRPPMPIDAQCIFDNGGAEMMMLRDLHARAESILIFGVDLSEERSCGWPCTCTSTVAYAAVAPGTWTVAPNATTCRYGRPANKIVTYAGETWLLCNNCAATITTPGRQNFQSNRLPGDSCPPSPPAGSRLVWSRLGLPGYP